MPNIEKLLYSRVANVLMGILLAFIWIIFALRNIDAFFLTGKFAFIIFCVSESLQAALFLMRRVPREVSSDIFDWMVGVGGTFAPFLLLPGGAVLSSFGEHLVLLAVCLQILGLISLNTSFAIVAARRNIKQRGMYSFVRHPLYAAYIPLFIGYFLFNASYLNALLVAASFAFLFLRIGAEEKLLGKSAEYQEYMQRVRWRLIPGVY